MVMLFQISMSASEMCARLTNSAVTQREDISVLIAVQLA